MKSVKNSIVIAIFASLTLACGASTQGSIQSMEHGFQTMEGEGSVDTSVIAVESNEAEPEEEVAQEDVEMQTSDELSKPIVRRPIVNRPCHNVHCGFSIPTIERSTIGFGDTSVDPSAAMPTTNSSDFGYPEF